MPSVCPQLTPEALIQAAIPALSAKKQAQRGLRDPGLYVEIQALSPPVGHRVTPEQGWDPATFPADQVYLLLGMVHGLVRLTISL